MHCAFATPSVVSTTRSNRLSTTSCPIHSTTAFPRVPLRRIAVMTQSTETESPAEEIPADQVEAPAPEASESATEQPAPAKDGPSGILMLCWGNICRSPAAEAVMKSVLKEKDLSSKFFVDSCGTGGGSPNWYKENGSSHHTGSYADVRMQYAAEQRGYQIDSQSRPLNKDDFEKFDYIIAMDESNLESIETARQYWGIEDSKVQIKLMSEFSSDAEFRGKGVPDPYYLKQDGFDHALDLILDSCNGLAEFLVKS